MNVVLATGLLYSFQQSDMQGKVIVVILCLGSALTWSVVITKLQQLRQFHRGADRFLEHFRRNNDPLHLYISNFEMQGCPLYHIYRSGAEEMSTQFGRGSNSQRVTGGYKSFNGGPAGGGTALLTEVDTETARTDSVVNTGTLRNALGRAIDAEVLKLESQVSWLSTAVQGGPFLGLMGSAWGVMSVFGEMGVYGTVRLGAVAPGISAALLATVVGLFVAVPSLFAYNYLVSRIRQQTVAMENFADEFMAAVEHNYVTN